MINKQESDAKISKLFTQSDEQIDLHKQTDFNETLIRRDFCVLLVRPEM